MGSVKSKKTAFYSRRAHYAGSWYESSSDSLNASLERYLKDANEGNSPSGCVVRALVAPHAGYAYSGATAAHAYRVLNDTLKEDTTIPVLHPSHYVSLEGCAVSGASVIETPIGNLDVNSELREEILEISPLFTVMDKATDEQEHSGELQYPYIRKAVNDVGCSRCKVLPIMVGSLDVSQEEVFGKLLAPILARPNVITVISSDFCHWGPRFRYQPFLKQEKHIFVKIEEMDRAGMEHIALQEPGAFAAYLKETSNTICGRHPLGVWLQAVKHNKDTGVERLDVKFVRYAQSSQARSKHDSSVSYASAVARQAN
jgi:AmmeMemoRadiSam system protein B